MTWRLYAQRSTTGEWLHTDVPAVLDLTWELNGTGFAAGFIPAALDLETAADGRPMWWERGTTLYAEEDDELKWVGLCSWQRPTARGRELEFKGLTSALDLIEFDGHIREWQPDPFDLVERIVANAQEQPRGDVGLHVVADGNAPTYAGDEQPAAERPENVHRRKGETKEHFLERKEDRQGEQEEWDRIYGDRRPYDLAWWEAPYAGEELRELANEIPFDWRERHRWTNRDQLERRSELVLTPRAGRGRSDLAIVEGINLAAPLDPQTDPDRYGNHVIMLGAGEGRKMLRAHVGINDGRIRTTRYGEAKHVHNEKRLEASARARLERAKVSVRVDEAQMRGDLGGLDLGDDVRITTSVFSGWARVFAITRNTKTGNVTLTFTEGAS